MTPWVTRLLAANVVVFVLTASQPRLANLLAFVPALTLVRPWTVITYMFVHANFTHLLFNMIGLFFFGPRLEDRLGSRGFLFLYFLSGLGGALFFFLFEPAAAVVGASGAVYGILMGFAYYWPREPIYIWAILPVQARWLALFLVVVSLYSGITGTGSGISHFAHLGGIAVGLGYLKWIEWRHERRKQKRRIPDPSAAARSRGSDRTSLARWHRIPVESLHELNREEVRQLVAKAEAQGVKSLSAAERSFLDRMAESSTPP